MKKLTYSQENIVAGLTIIIFFVFSLTLNQFLSAGNLASLVRGVSILGILSLAMSIAVIGRGIDLALVATMITSMAVGLTLAKWGWAMPAALGAGLLFAIGIGLLVGTIVAYAEIPAIFTTLAMAPIAFSLGRSFFFDVDLITLPQGIRWLEALGYGSLFGVPYIILAFGLMCIVVHLILGYTVFGRFIYAAGDNPLTAKITGLPLRPVIVSQYVIGSVIAFSAALVMAASNSSINTRLMNSTMVYDVLLVVVLGGIGLSGGRGGVRNVIIGTLLVGTLLNGMTIMDVNYTFQNLIKSTILLGALVVDTLLNPRDEQTAQQGDI